MIQRVFWLFLIVIVTFQTGTTFEAFFAKMRSFYNAKQCCFFRGKPGLYGARPAFRRRIRGVSPPAAVQKLITGERKKREKSETVKRAGKTGNHKSI